MLQAIIKVSKSSDIKFNNVQAYRAINYREVERLLSNNHDIAFVVFEEVKESDITRVKNIMKSFKITAIVYNKDGSSKEVEELGIYTVNNLKELQLYVENTLGVNVSTFKKEVVVNDNNGDENKGSQEFIEEEPTIIDEQAKEEIITGLEEAIQASNDNFDSELQEEKVEDVIIMSKQDILVEDDSLDDLFDSVEDDTDIGGITLDDLEKIQQYEEEINGLKGQLEYALENVKNLSEVRVYLEGELKQFKDFIERLQVSDTVIEVTSSFQSKIELENSIAEMRDTISTLELEVAENLKLEKQINELNAVIESKDTIIDELTSKIENSASSEIVLTLKERLKTEVNARLFVTQSLGTVVNELESTQGALTKKLHEVGNLLKEYRNLEVKLDTIQKEKEELEQSKVETETALTNKVEELNLKVSYLENELNDSKQKLIESEIQKSTYESDIESLTAIFEGTQKELDDTKRRLDRELMEVHRFQAMGVEEIESNMKALEESNSTLAEEIGRLRRDKDDLERQLELKDRNIGKLSEQVNALSTTAKALTRNMNAGETIKISCNYTGRAFILPVFGSGSYGITSTAVSLAHALDGRVLLLDFDTVSPKIDSWYEDYKIIIDELPDISNKLKKTGLGALIEKGTEYVINHKDKLITTVHKSKGGSNVDFFSGAYTKIDMYKLMAVNFTEFLNYFGHEYDYIVVDLGRIGGSEITNALIRMFDEISFKNIVVGLHDGFDCRTLTVRVQSEQLDRSKTVMVLNLASSDKLDDLIKQCVTAGKYVIFYRDMKIFGSRTTYNNVKVLKDRLSKLIELILQ